VLRPEADREAVRPRLLPEEIAVGRLAGLEGHRGRQLAGPEQLERPRDLPPSARVQRAGHVAVDGVEVSGHRGGGGTQRVLRVTAAR
jgi:hypothetical protein